MATVQMRDVTFTEDYSYQIDGQSYSFVEGSTVRLPRSVASRLVERYSVGRYADESVEILERDYDDEVGKVLDNAESDSLEDMSYSELQDLAKENDIAANQSRDELIAELDKVL